MRPWHEPRNRMVGLSQADLEQIENFANTPRYARSPNQLCAEEDQESDP